MVQLILQAIISISNNVIVSIPQQIPVPQLSSRSPLVTIFRLDLFGLSFRCLTSLVCLFVVWLLVFEGTILYEPDELLGFRLAIGYARTSAIVAVYILRKYERRMQMICYNLRDEMYNPLLVRNLFSEKSLRKYIQMCDFLYYTFHEYVSSFIFDNVDTF